MNLGVGQWFPLSPIGIIDDQFKLDTSFITTTVTATSVLEKECDIFVEETRWSNRFNITLDKKWEINTNRPTTTKVAFAKQIEALENLSLGPEMYACKSTPRNVYYFRSKTSGLYGAMVYFSLCPELYPYLTNCYFSN